MVTFKENQVFAVGPGVYVREAVDNCAWADLGDGVVVIDALEDAEMESVIRADIASTVNKPLKWVINTHWHKDHIACNPAWARLGATIIAHESCAPASKERDGRPDITFQDHYTLKGSERTVELEWLGGTHTPADTVVHFPWARVLHIADLFGWGLFPMQRITPATIDRMRAVINRILTYDVDTLICGHGPTLTPAQLRRWLEYFDDIMARAPDWRQSGMDIAALKAQTPPPADMQDWWRFAAWKHARNLEMVTE
ncbi:MAG: MBL fold metallo-hydrolase [Chloroflexi bacterium]|nr:MBL fold metallo-hydrolase [Chloroflexota bacterium]